MELPFLDGGVGTLEGGDLSVYEMSVDSPALGGFSTFQPHGKPGGVFGLAKVYCWRGMGGWGEEI